MSEAKIYYPGDIIFGEGDISTDVYLIKEGKVRIVQRVHGKDVEVTRLTAGDIFGEMALFDKSPRSASAIAIENSRVYVISELQIQSILDNSPIWFKALIRVLIKRLRETTAKYNILSAAHPLEGLKGYVSKELEQGKNIDDLSQEFAVRINDIEGIPLRNLIHHMIKEEKI